MKLTRLEAAVASALLNARGQRNVGLPPIENVLDFVPAYHREAALDDARAVLAAIAKFNAEDGVPPHLQDEP